MKKNVGKASPLDQLGTTIGSPSDGVPPPWCALPADMVSYFGARSTRSSRKKRRYPAGVAAGVVSAGTATGNGNATPASAGIACTVAKALSPGTDFI